MADSRSRSEDLQFALPDRYRVEGILGRGGFGTVLVAYDQQLARRCAVKVARQDRLDARLLREARCASALRGPNIVRIFDVDALPSGAPYVVMECLEGQTLAEYLEEHGRVPWRTAVSWVEQICIALEEAHRAGLVHRDVKPSNLFLASDPITGTKVIKVLDFGLARSVDSQEVYVTESNLVLGSPAYMSPEQVRSAEVTALSDIWSLGVVLYQLVSGGHPFRHDTKAATLAAIVADPPRPLEALAPDVPRALVLLVERCLSKKPEDRPASAWELARCLRALNRPAMDDTSVATGTVTDTQEVSTPIAPTRPSARVAHLSGYALVAVAVVLLLGWLHRAQRNTQPWSRPSLAREEPVLVQSVLAAQAPHRATASIQQVHAATEARTTAERPPPSLGKPDSSRFELPRVRVAQAPPPASPTESKPQKLSESGLFEEPDF